MSITLFPCLYISLNFPVLVSITMIRFLMLFRLQYDVGWKDLSWFLYPKTISLLHEKLIRNEEMVELERTWTMLNFFLLSPFDVIKTFSVSTSGALSLALTCCFYLHWYPGQTASSTSVVFPHFLISSPQRSLLLCRISLPTPFLWCLQWYYNFSPLYLLN